MFFFSKLNPLPVRDSANVALSKMTFNEEDFSLPKEEKIVPAWNPEDSDPGYDHPEDLDPGPGLASLDRLQDRGVGVQGLGGLDDLKYDLSRKRLGTF